MFLWKILSLEEKFSSLYVIISLRGMIFDPRHRSFDNNSSCSFSPPKKKTKENFIVADIYIYIEKIGGMGRFYDSIRRIFRVSTMR